MKTYTIEIETDLNELEGAAIDEIKRSIAWLVSEGYQFNRRNETLSDAINDRLEYDGTKHEIIDGCVPVYTYHLEALFFAHKRVLMDAFLDSGISTVEEVLANPDSFVLGLEGVAIFCYIENSVNQWIQDDLETWFSSKFGGSE
tara:strand:+ start:462 stop:893 length:432 start_codon:yes stop_codon:yes gene_type:complete